MANNFSTGLQMGMGLARDVRSANLASAERKERSKYRKSAEARAVSAEKRAVSRDTSAEKRAVSAEKRAVSADVRKVSAEGRAVKESDLRIESLKKGMVRSASAEERAVSAEGRAVSAARRAFDADTAKRLNDELSRKILQQKLQDSQNPIITALDHNAGALEKYSKMQKAADARNADTLGPLNAAIGVAERTNSPDLPNLLAMRDKMVADHKDFKAGLEQSFMAASNRPYEGKWSIRPYFNEFKNTMSYGAVFEGGSAAEAKSAFESIKSMGGSVGISAGASAASPVPSVDPNDPLGIRSQTPFNPPQLGPAP